jgi:hypothetical protein
MAHQIEQKSDESNENSVAQMFKGDTWMVLAKL